MKNESSNQRSISVTWSGPGERLRVGNRVATAEGRLEDAERKLYAHATTTCIVLPAATKA